MSQVAVAGWHNGIPQNCGQVRERSEKKHFLSALLCQNGLMECHSLVFESYADDMDHQHFLSMPPAIRSMTVSTPRWACENSTPDLRPRRISISSNTGVIICIACVSSDMDGSISTHTVLL